MLREEKNLKDSQRDTIKDTSSITAPYQAVGFRSGSYTKTNKLITALYMVTDIIDKDEPLRNKLRTLGIGIISDMDSVSSNIRGKISETMSFLDIASAMNIVSEMNCSILKKEFLELDQSILSAQAGKESVGEVKTLNKQINLSEFFNSPLEEYPLGGGGEFFHPVSQASHPSKREIIYKGHTNGHQYQTSLGVQKGSTLLKALSDKIDVKRHQNLNSSSAQNFDVFKKQRRDDIINIIKTIGGNATIKDIKDRAQISQTKTGSIVSCSEKTLQRELVSMVKDGVLKKAGEKRWSRYFLK